MQTGSQMQRGEIRYVDFEPARNSEASKRRPAVIVSNDHANRIAEHLGRGVVTVIPITSNTARVFPFQVLLTAEDTGLPRDSKAQTEQVRSVSTERVGERLGKLTIDLMRRVDDALRLHLDLLP